MISGLLNSLGLAPTAIQDRLTPLTGLPLLATAEHSIDLLEQGASGLQQYDAWDGYYEHHESMGYWGLLAYDSRTGTYSPRKTYFILQQLIRHTPRNSVRMAASSDQEAVRVVAFHDKASGRVTLFGQNSSDKPVEAVLQAPGVARTVQFSSNITDAVQNMQSGESAVMEHGTVRYAAPPRFRLHLDRHSIERLGHMTLTGSLRSFVQPAALLRPARQRPVLTRETDLAAQRSAGEWVTLGGTPVRLLDFDEAAELYR